jgi:hypothetical protein
MNMRSKAILLIAILVFIAKNLSAQEWDGQGTQFNAESILRNQVVLPFIFFGNKAIVPIYLVCEL